MLEVLASRFSNSSISYDLTGVDTGGEVLIMSCSSPARLAVIHSVPYNGQTRCMALRVGESGTLPTATVPLYKLRTDGLCIVKQTATQSGGSISNTAIAIFG